MMAKTVTNQWAGYQRATIADFEKHRLLGLSDGEPGSRKTSFWLEGPSPVVVFSMDRGLEGVVDRILREQPNKEIYVKEYDWFPRVDVDLQQEAVDLVEQFTQDWERALSDARTVIMDKEDDFWAVVRYAEWGNGMGKGENQRDYDKVNAQMRKFINDAKASNANVGFIDGMKDKWGDVTKKNGSRGAAATGERERKGFKELEGQVHLVLHHTGLSPSDWQVTVGKVRGPGGRKVAGETIDACTFVEFALQIFPESEEDEWT